MPCQCHAAFQDVGYNYMACTPFTSKRGDMSPGSDAPAAHSTVHPFTFSHSADSASFANLSTSQRRTRTNLCSVVCAEEN